MCIPQARTRVTSAARVMICASRADGRINEDGPGPSDHLMRIN